MKALAYLTVKQWKNTLLNLLRHPVQLISYALIVGMIFYSMLTGRSTADTFDTYADIRLLQLLYFAVLTVVSVLTLQSGVKSGSTFFNMPDVNLLFVSPMHPKLILFYGLFKQMSSTLLMMLFLLIYSPMLMNYFGITITDVVVLIVGFALVLLLQQLLSMVLYSFCNGNPGRRQAAKMLIYGVTLLLAVSIAGVSLQNGGGVEGLLKATDFPVLLNFPITGWITSAIFLGMQGQISAGIIYWALFIVSLLIILVLLVKSNPDYYEDVLQSTEQVFQAKEAIKEGSEAVQMLKTDRKVSLKKEGLGGGFGASTFFYKHLCEIRRRNRLGFLTTSSLLITAVGLIAAIFIQRSAAGEGDPIEGSALFGIILLIQLYLLFFFTTTGDWIMELKKPYIYLVPASAFSKLIWVCMTTLLKPVADGALAFVALWLLLRVNPIILIAAILIYSSSSFLFTAGSVLFCRIFGALGSNKLLGLVQYLISVLLLMPGTVVFGALVIVLELPWYLAGLAFVPVSIAIALGVFAICRNVLETAELR